MLYTLHEYAYHSALPFRIGAQMARDFWSHPGNPAAATAIGRTLYASSEVIAGLTRRYGKPAWNIDSVEIEGRDVRVVEHVVWSSPWCRLVHFARHPADMRKAGRKGPSPTVLIVAPIGLSLARQLGYSPDPFLMAVAIGAGCDFLTPIGHQCNTLVLGPAGYKFSDYGRLGAPLSLLILGVAPSLIAWFWPFT